MRVITTDTNKVYNIRLMVWTSGWNAGYSPDCFSDLEVTFTEITCTEIDGNYYCPEAEVKDLINWWESEVDAANSDDDYHGDGLYSLPDNEEWVLDYDVSDADSDIWWCNVQDA